MTVATDAWSRYRRKYNQSVKGKVAKTKYEASPKGKAAIARYQRSEKGKAKSRASSARHHLKITAALGPITCACGASKERTPNAKSKWRCPDCQRAANRLAQARSRAKRSRMQKLEQNLRHNQGMQLEEYMILYREQNGRCAACGKEPDEEEWLQVDHDHACPEPHPKNRSCARCRRGLLCRACNQALGMVGDDQAVLLALVAYLSRRGQSHDRLS